MKCSDSSGNERQGRQRVEGSFCDSRRYRWSKKCQLCSLVFLWTSMWFIYLITFITNFSISLNTITWASTTSVELVQITWPPEGEWTGSSTHCFLHTPILATSATIKLIYIYIIYITYYIVIFIFIFSHIYIYIHICNMIYIHIYMYIVYIHTYILLFSH